jgi:hypothetical protein
MKHKDNQHKETQHENTEHNDQQHNDIHHKYNNATLSITLKANTECHHAGCHFFLSVSIKFIMPNAVMLSVMAPLFELSKILFKTNSLKIQV